MVTPVQAVEVLVYLEPVAKEARVVRNRLEEQPLHSVDHVPLTVQDNNCAVQMAVEDQNLTVGAHSLVCTGVEFGLPGQEEMDVMPAVVAEATGAAEEAVVLQTADKVEVDPDILVATRLLLSLAHQLHLTVTHVIQQVLEIQIIPETLVKELLAQK